MAELKCCHTYPNDKLLQPLVREYNTGKKTVVIPIQTISFYNQMVRFTDTEVELSYLSKR